VMAALPHTKTRWWLHVCGLGFSRRCPHVITPSFPDVLHSHS
jgi:hypothetical protein